MEIGQAWKTLVKPWPTFPSRPTASSECVHSQKYGSTTIHYTVSLYRNSQCVTDNWKCSSSPNEYSIEDQNQYSTLKLNNFKNIERTYNDIRSLPRCIACTNSPFFYGLERERDRARVFASVCDRFSSTTTTHRPPTALRRAYVSVFNIIIDSKWNVNFDK